MDKTTPYYRARFIAKFDKPTYDGWYDSDGFDSAHYFIAVDIRIAQLRALYKKQVAKGWNRKAEVTKDQLNILLSIAPLARLFKAGERNA